MSDSSSPAGANPPSHNAGQGAGQPGLASANPASLAGASAGLQLEAHTARPSVIQLVFREKGALYAAYIPLFTEGGLFVPTNRKYRLSEDIYLLISLPDDAQRYPVAGRVGWITPANASGGRTAGVGVRFPSDEKARLLKLRIEEALGTLISSHKPTQTV